MTWFWSSTAWATYCEAMGLPGPVDNSDPTNLVVPLGPVDRMLANMRQTTRYTIRHADNLGATWPTTRAWFDVYQGLHEKASGRKTRPQRTFDLMYDWIVGGDAELLVAHTLDVPQVAGASLWICHKDGVYYASSAREPSLQREHPVGHFMVWAAMEHFAARGYQWLDLGHGHVDDGVDEKDRKKQEAIITFKRGFVRGTDVVY